MKVMGLDERSAFWRLQELATDKNQKLIDAAQAGERDHRADDSWGNTDIGFSIGAAAVDRRDNPQCDAYNFY